MANRRTLPRRPHHAVRYLPLGLLGVALGCASTPPPGPPPPTLLSVFGTTRFACTLVLPEAGELRSVAEASLDGQRLQLRPRPFALPLRGGAVGAPASAPWDLATAIGTPFGGTEPQSLVGRFSAAFLSADFSGQLNAAGMEGDLTAGDGRAAGRLIARPAGEPSARSYKELARRIDSAARGAWVDPRRLELTPWKTFIEDLQRGFAECADDVEVWLCYQRALQELNAPGLSLLRPVESALEKPAANSVPPRSLPRDWAWAAPTQLASAVEIDRTFQAWPLELRGAILDLRGSGPADVHLVRLLTWLGLPAETLGVLASQNNFRIDRDPKGPVVERPAEGLYDLPPGGWPARLRLMPGDLPPQWLARGRLELLVLLDRDSGPTATALALGLRSRGRARLVGAAPKRPGEVLRGVPLGDGFELSLPVAHFLGQDGAPLAEQAMAVDLPANSPRETDLAAVGLAL
jgi:hypothetical protein